MALGSLLVRLLLGGIAALNCAGLLWFSFQIHLVMLKLLKSDELERQPEAPIQISVSDVTLKTNNIV